MPEGFRLSQMLRPVGQMLETLNLESFSLRVDSEKVSVQGQKRVERQDSASAGNVAASCLASFAPEKAGAQERRNQTPESSNSDYTRDDIERIDSEGKVRSGKKLGVDPTLMHSHKFFAL
jgi:hypothetical protein